jgi:hypothetical protein
MYDYNLNHELSPYNSRLPTVENKTQAYTRINMMLPAGEQACLFD